MTNPFQSTHQTDTRAGSWDLAADGSAVSTANIPDLLAGLYDEAPATLRPRLLEYLLRPVGPLAIVTIASGAFAHLLYRLRLDGVPISPDDAARVSPEHVFQLARFVEQCSPHALLRMGSLIAANPVFVASMSGSALLAALGAWRRRRSGRAA